MNIVFVSNYFNHHQKPFCEEMFRRLGENFTFIATGVMGEERKKLGYAQEKPVYVLAAYGGTLERKRALSLINEADIVIAGAAPDHLLLERIRSGKIVLRYSERPFKLKSPFYKKLYHAYRQRKRDGWGKNVHMLCASAFSSQDYASIGMYRKRAYKWGYFPAMKEYDEDALQAGKKRNTIMWCGRFIECKHAEDTVRLAHKLKENGYDFHLNFVGLGELEEGLRQLVESLGLTDCVHFLGAMSPDQVRTHMEEAGIYLFTSDRRDGWGAVMNESMNSGCAVVVSHAVGSAPFLVKHGENGLIFPCRDVDAMYDRVSRLLDQPQEQERLGRAAYKTIATEWNAQTAAERFLHLAERLLASEPGWNLYQTGPCSMAERIKDNWFKDR